MKPIVVDTSVVFKWYRQTDDEEHVAQALALLNDHLDGVTALSAPDLLIYELGNLLSLKRESVSEPPVTILRRTLLLELQIHPIDQLLAERALAAASAPCFSSMRVPSGASIMTSKKSESGMPTAGPKGKAALALRKTYPCIRP
mgnify:CR=1 FL=1